MSQSASSSKDLALRAIGRTVVNFQRLEHNLKLAAQVGPLQGTLAKIQVDAERRVKRAATLTLGQAIQTWLAAANSEPMEAGYTPDLFDATLEMTFSLVPDTEQRSAHAIALKSLLEARNRLVHGGLVRVQWDSPDECARLIAELDGINEAIREQLAFVTSILSAFRTIGGIRQEDIDRGLDELPGQNERVIKVAGDA